MPTVTFPPDMQRFTDGASEVQVSALRFPDLVEELCSRFPALTEETIRKQAMAIDGMIIHEPLLESFQADSELVFFARIAGG